jgi:hypothetical protein
MHTKRLIAISTAVLLIGAVYGGRQWVAVERSRAAESALAQAAAWSPAAQRTARVMIERYGPPQESSAYQLRWHGPRPWKRIVVQNEPQSPLEDVVTYDVPPIRLAALDRFPHGLQVYAAEGALSARSDRESLNILSLNLADGIVRGRTTPEEANREFVRILELHDAGKSTPAMERLLFTAPIEADPRFPIP